MSSMNGNLPPIPPISNDVVAHDPTTAAALQFLSDRGLAGQLGRRAMAGGTPTAIEVSSLEALFASQHRFALPFQQAPSLQQQARMAMLGGGDQQLMSHSLLANDLQQAATLRVHDLANIGMQYAALTGQIPTYQGTISNALGGFVGLGMASRGAVLSDHDTLLAAAARAQRSFGFASSGGGGMPSFLDTETPFANHGVLNQLLLRQQVPTSHHLALHPALGFAGTTSVAQSNPAAWLNQHQPAVSADLLFARHGPAVGTIPPNHSARLSLETQTYGERDNKGIPMDLPVLLCLAEDHVKLSTHQVLLRQQIEAFRATEEDVSTHTRGRNKPVAVNQVGIRCRYCAYVPVGKRQKGSTYFPAALLGLYQAAQNMSTTHMQCGLCSEMPNEIKQQFAHLISTKVASSGAGRPYWARAAKKLGLVDSEDGIRFIRDLPSDDEARLVDRGDAMET
jgi:hypothetical protein